MYIFNNFSKIVPGLVMAFLSMSLQAEVISLEATYSVPVQSPEDLKINSFQLKNYQVETFEDGRAVMSFEVPGEMVGVIGQKYELNLIGKTSDTQKILSGPSAKAVCVGPWKNMECSIGFLKLKMDKSDLQAELNSKYSVQEADARFELLLKFNNDPIGTVKVVKPNSPVAQ